MDPEITDVFITENKITIIDVTAARNLYQHHVEEQLPKDRTKGYRLFQVVGADFVGLITCKIKENNEIKLTLCFPVAAFSEHYTWRFLKINQ